jgi:signal transduction histidine kinase
MMPKTPRILIADDLPAIHEDYRKILAPRSPKVSLTGMADFAPRFAQASAATETLAPPQIDSVMQGEDAVQAVIKARDEGYPFALVFLDVRMPPGIDGVETAMRLRAVDPDLQIVLCTAYSDYSFMEISKRFKESDGLLILKKPFDPVEVQQISQALCRKWLLSIDNKAILENLEARVRQRTAELEHAKARLELALLGAEAANRAKTDFLQCISHELNTPLNGIMGAASVIELSSDAESAELGRIVHQSSERLNRLFSRILRYLTIGPTPCTTSQSMNMQVIVDAAVAPHLTAAIRAGIQLLVDNRCPPLLNLNGEAQQLSQALDCLVENAIKFTARGRIDVRLRVEEGTSFVAEVMDTGPGISGQQLDKLYELFSPGDTRTNRKHDGVGIGLTFSKRVAEYFGGRLEFRNRDEGGSVFTLTLPCSIP